MIGLALVEGGGFGRVRIIQPVLRWERNINRLRGWHCREGEISTLEGLRLMRSGNTWSTSFTTNLGVRWKRNIIGVRCREGEVSWIKFVGLLRSWSIWSRTSRGAR